MRVSPLVWDSHFFKKEVGEIFLINEDEEILNALDFALIYVKAENLVNKEINGFINTFHETKIVFSKNLKNSLLEHNSHVISVFETHFVEKDLYPLAFISGIYSRFKLDTNFTKKNFTQLYKKWIDNSFAKLIADEIFIFIENEKILGFVSFKIKKNKGIIGLFAVDKKAQGKGVGATLIRYVENYLITKNIFQLDIPTQASNDIACKFYKKMGYDVKESTEIYHFWKI